MNVAPPRAIFDCNVLLQAILSAGPAFRCLQLVESGNVVLLASAATVGEIQNVLARPRLIAKYPQLTSDRTTAFLSLLVRKSTAIDPVAQQFQFPRDPKDEIYLDLALAGNADFLVTRDKDLLTLEENHAERSAVFGNRCPKLKILEPTKFLDLIVRS